MRHASPSILAGIIALTSTLLQPAAAADLAHGEKVFRACASCHSLDADGKGFGPTLHGIVGRPAAQVANFSYSPAMKAAAASGLVWDEKTLAEFLAKPQAKVPGTAMRFWGLWSWELADVIAYIKAAAARP
ncbi:MAG: cytochrome c family protein [Tardiphaga sp.]